MFHIPITTKYNWWNKKLGWKTSGRTTSVQCRQFGWQKISP